MIKSNCPRYQCEFNSGMDTSRLNTFNDFDTNICARVSCWDVDCRMVYVLLIVSNILLLVVFDVVLADEQLVRKNKMLIVRKLISIASLKRALR